MAIPLRDPLEPIRRGSIGGRGLVRASGFPTLALWVRFPTASNLQVNSIVTNLVNIATADILYTCLINTFAF